MGPYRCSFFPLQHRPVQERPLLEHGHPGRVHNLYSIWRFKKTNADFFHSIPFSWRCLFLLGALETATGPASQHQNARIGAGQRRETAQQGACFTSILRNKSAEVLQCGFWQIAFLLNVTLDNSWWKYTFNGVFSNIEFNVCFNVVKHLNADFGLLRGSCQG